jgi:hypothetical protein
LLIDGSSCCTLGWVASRTRSVTGRFSRKPFALQTPSCAR